MLGGVRVCSAVVVLVEVSRQPQTRTRSVESLLKRILYLMFSRGAQVGYTEDRPCNIYCTPHPRCTRYADPIRDRAHVILARLAGPHSRLTSFMIAPISTLPLIPLIGSVITIQIKLVIIFI